MLTLLLKGRIETPLREKFLAKERQVVTELHAVALCTCFFNIALPELTSHRFAISSTAVANGPLF
jgi:hypothetical protein